MIKYESQFSSENITALSEKLKSAISGHAKEQDIKIDLFVILAALGVTALDYSVAILPRNDEERQKALKESEMVSEQILRKFDALHVEHKHMGMSDLIAIASTLSSMAEYYSRMRDKNIAEVQRLQTPDPSATVENEATE